MLLIINWLVQLYTFMYLSMYLCAMLFMFYFNNCLFHLLSIFPKRQNNPVYTMYCIYWTHQLQLQGTFVIWDIVSFVSVQACLVVTTALRDLFLLLVIIIIVMVT